MQPLARRQVSAPTGAKAAARSLEEEEARQLLIGAAPVQQEPAGWRTSPTLIVDGLAVTEVAIAVVAALVAKLGYLDLLRGFDSPNLPYVGLGLLLGFILHVVYRQFELYDPKVLQATSMGPAKVVGGLLLSFLLLLSLMYLLKISEFYSRGWVLAWVMLSAVMVGAARGVFLRHARRLTTEGRMRRRIAICGDAGMGLQLKEQLGASCPGVDIVAYYDDQAPLATVDPAGDAAGLERLIADARNGAFDQVIVTVPAAERKRIWDAIEALAVLPMDVQLCTEPFALGVPVHGSRALGEVNVHLVLPRPLSERSAVMKRCLDYVVATLALLLFAPLLVLIALAIKLDSRGPVLFRQRRLGQNQKVFQVYKFRTMRVMEDGEVVKQAERNDSRVTRVGRILRSTSMDELPQLLNVLRGEMSIVGPRPHAVVHDQEFMKRLAHYSRRHRVRPGITGWAQVNGLRGETRTAEQLTKRMEHDLYYIDNWSIWLDLEIMLRTFVAVLPGRGAY